MCKAACVYNDGEAGNRRPQPQANDLFNTIPEEILIGKHCNLAIMFIDQCLFAEKLLVDLDLLSRSKMGNLHNFFYV
jgi:hypothetical protein